MFGIIVHPTPNKQTPSMIDIFITFVVAFTLASLLRLLTTRIEESEADSTTDILDWMDRDRDDDSSTSLEIDGTTDAIIDAVMEWEMRE